MGNLKEIFLERYPKRGKILDFYFEANGIEINWDNLSKISLCRMVAKMEEKLAPNTTRQYCALIKSILTLCEDTHPLHFDWSKILSLPESMSTNIFVSEDDITKLIKLENLTDTEKFVRDQFVIGCLTGARHSDFLQFTCDNVNDGWLTYVSKKTKIATEIPVAPFVFNLIKAKSSSLKSRNITDVYFNKILKIICMKAKINETCKIFHAGKYLTGKKYNFITSHTARRSCATNLALRGVDEIWIARILGHGKNITQRYVCVTNRDMPKKAKDYFLKIR